MLGSLGNLFQRIGRLFQPSELRGLDPACADQLARDVGVSPYDLHRLSELGPEAADLIYQRLALENLDAQEVERQYPKVMKDLQRVCSVCDDKKRCQHDFENHVAGDDWKSYCPNASTITDLGR